MTRWLLLFALTVSNAFAQGTKADYERALSLEARTEKKVFRAKVEPHWLPGGEAFWYRNDLAGGQREFVLVDAVKGERRVLPGPPEQAVPEQLALEEKPRPSTRGDDEARIVFVNRTSADVQLFWIDREGEKKGYGSVKAGERRGQHTYAGHVWLAQDEMGRTLGVWEAKADEGEAIIETLVKLAKPPATAEPRPDATPRVWEPFLRDFNVWLKHRETGETVQLSGDGHAGNAYREPLLVSPDGTKLLALQVEPAQEHKVHLIASSPSDQLEPKLTSHNYLKAGDRIAHEQPRLFDLANCQPIAVKDDLFPNPWDISELRWSPDSARFTFLYNQRGHQVLRMIAVDATTGQARALVDEQSKTFIDYSQKTFAHWLDATHELVWMSERDGWNHLWLYDTQTGQVKNQITCGKWVVRAVERVDAEKRQIWFRCAGIRAGQDPYYVHLARVNFDGTGLLVLTEGDGTREARRGRHSAGWRFSPDGRWFLDTWSRVDLPPVTELRRASDGQLVCVLETADASALLATGWRTPERFIAKGRDGTTDIHGIIIRPSNFNPAKKYPVLEEIYAGPHGYFVPKEWGRSLRQDALAELGFIVVQIDGMGTNWRSRAFHDVAWKNLKDAGFPDRIAWLRAAAAKHPEMDLTRVGIYGGSAGGQNALAALLHHGDFYKAAVSDCGCHDNRMDKIWWNEAWMGWPVGPEYADSSNVTHAAKLTGKLLLTVGELDHNVDPASTMQVVNALMKADKDFEMLVVPGSDHGAGERSYMVRRRMDFFVRHFFGTEPRSQ